MATAYRSSQSVTNGTAGTSVTVSKPAGIVDTGSNPDRDQLVAFVAATGAPTFTEPAGWTLITSAVDAGSGVTLKAYRKLASSEGASWTWTLGASQRNWGWVGAYTGVDPDDPIYSAGFSSEQDLILTTSTVLNVAANTIPGGHVLAAAAAVRTASGSATTWAVTGAVDTPDERADLSTNAGAGTDIAGAVGDREWDGLYISFAAAEFTASQTQTAGVAMMFGLRPYFVPYGAGIDDAGLIVEAAIGVDPDSDSTTWTWTDLTSFVHQPSMLVLDHGRANRTSVADPSRMAFTLLNLNGEFTSPTGTYAAQMVRNLPFRVRLNGFGTMVGGTGYHRGTALLASMRPRWDTSTNFAVVDIVAQGRLRRMQRHADVLKSAAYTAIQRMASTSGYVTPIAHWPFEDESGATTAASAVPGVDPIAVTNVTFGADSTVVGAAPLAQLTATSAITTLVPTYADTGTWTAMFCMAVPTEPASEIILLDVITSGTANRWRLALTPGTTTLTVQVFSSAGSVLFNSGGALTESTFYGFGYFYTFTATQNGADVDFEAFAYGPDGAGGGKVGTVSSQTLGVAKGLTVGVIGGLNGFGFGHLAVHVQPGADGSFTSTAVVDGNTGDWPWSRFQRLCVEQNVPYTMDQSDNQDLEMGPQPVATLMTLLRECEVVEGCVLNDSGEFAGETGTLWFPARDDRENIAATMTLDIASGQVAASFAPALDDQDIVNDVEVSRTGGSSARVTDDASIALEGRVRELVTVNTEDDTFLRHLAGWRVNLGTVKGMRFPAVAWNMRHSPELAQEWMACRLFHRIDITNPPSQYPPDDIQTLLEGYTEVLSSDLWMVRGNLSPYQPNKVLVVAEDAGDVGDYVARVVGDADAAIRGAVTDSATSIAFDPNRYRWTALMLKDTATRTVAAGSWGTPDVGTAWAIDEGTASYLSVNGSALVMSHATIANLSQKVNVGTPDQDCTMYFRLPVAPTGGSAAAIALFRFRFTDASNYYDIRVTTDAAGTMAFVVRVRVGGSTTVLATGTSLTLDITHTYGLRVSAHGTTLRAKFWDNTTTTQPDWQIVLVEPTLTTGNTVLILTVPSNVTNVLPFDFWIDNVSVVSPGSDVDDFPLDARLGGEVVTVSSIATTPVTFVAVGAASSADAAAVSPAIYSGDAADDLIVVVAGLRSTPGTTGAPTTPTGYHRLDVFDDPAISSAGAINVQIYVKRHDGSESAPSVGVQEVAAGDTLTAFTFGLRNVPLTVDLDDLVADFRIQTNAAATDIAYPGLSPIVEGCFVLLVGWRQDDYTSIAPPSGFTEMIEASTTVGSDQGLYAAYQIQTLPAVINEGSMVVTTGGGTAASRSAVLALVGGFQTATVARGTNSVVKAHAASAKIEIEDCHVLGL